MAEEKSKCETCCFIGMGASICNICYSNPRGQNYIGKTVEEEQKRWTATQELRQQIQYREISQQVQYNRQINQLLDFQSRPNPFK